MLAFDLRSLVHTAATVDGVLSASDPVWKPEDRVPAGGVHLTGRLSAAGPGRFYFSGEIAGTAHDDCRRCLEGVDTKLAERVRMLFAQSGVDEEEEEDPDVYLFDPRAHDLDLREAVREQWLLIVPTFVQCKDDCAGLCPSCGADLNAGPCGCDPPGDDRWAVLRHLGVSRGGESGPAGGAPGTR
jgi:uncharacterized protein